MVLRAKNNTVKNVRVRVREDLFVKNYYIIVHILYYVIDLINGIRGKMSVRSLLYTYSES